MSALGFIKESIDSKQKELNRYQNDVARIYAQTDYDDGYGDNWADYHVGYGDTGYGDGWQDYTVNF